MPFPEEERVIYQKNPLAEVICQIKFPPILRIDAELPAQFQERIRQAYPQFQEKQMSEGEIALPPEMAQLLKSELFARRGRAAYDFVSSDGGWTVSLTRDFLSLSTRKYRRWEEFKEYLKEPLQTLKDVYSPSYVSRVGLRYRDLIRRHTLGLETVAWSELLKPHIAGVLASAAVEQEVTQSVSEIVLGLESHDGVVHIQHGMVNAKNQSKEEVIAYLIDSDFFTEKKTEVSDVITVLDYFNRQAGNLFKWCITERLHTAMEPRPVPPM